MPKIDHNHLDTEHEDDLVDNSPIIDPENPQNDDCVEPAHHHLQENAENVTQGPEVIGVPRRTTRQHKTPGWLVDYVTNAESAPALVVNVAYTVMQPKFCAFLAKSATVQDPKNFKAAIHDKAWVTAMNEEIQALETNNTWTLT